MQTLKESGFRLPDALVARGMSVRDEHEDDIPFLSALYASTRADELAMLPWPDEQKAAFLAQQFAAQRHHYRTQIDRCAFLVLEQAGVPIGRLYLETRQANLHIVDIALVPEWRCHGIGTVIVAEIIKQAGRLRKGVSLFVEPDNPASFLYDRLGFIPVDHGEVYMEMERPFLSNSKSAN